MALPISEWSCDVVLRDGSTVQLRPVRPGDAEPLRELYDRLSPESRYRRFFGVVPKLDDERLAFLAGADQEEHVALVAESRGRLVADARYIREGKGESAEVAFTVVDKYQGQGIGGSLMRHLTTLAREVGLKELIAEVLPENIPMLKVFENSGLRISAKQEDGVVH